MTSGELDITGLRIEKVYAARPNPARRADKFMQPSSENLHP
jgi:hypothetical protein